MLLAAAPVDATATMIAKSPRPSGDRSKEAGATVREREQQRQPGQEDHHGPVRRVGAETRPPLRTASARLRWGKSTPSMRPDQVGIKGLEPKPINRTMHSGRTAPSVT